MLNFENMSRPEMIAARRTIRDNLDTLTAIYKDTCTGNPAGHLSRAAPQSDPAPLPRRGKSKERRLEP